MSAGLLARARGDACPVAQSIAAALGVEFYDAELGVHGKYRFDAQLGCLLYDQVHRVGLDQCLQQHDARPRLGHWRKTLAQNEHRAVLRQRFDRRPSFRPVRIENDQRIADATAQYAPDVMGLLGIEHETRTLQIGVDEQAGRCFSVSVHGEDLAVIDYSSSLKKALSIDPASGWLRKVARVPSPNADERPLACVPSLIVVHGISLPPGEFGGPWIDRLFTNDLPADAHHYFAGIAGLRVSSHVLIRRSGEIRQYVPFTSRAWHAGHSSWCGRPACNDYSIGIELEGTDTTPYEDAIPRTIDWLRQRPEAAEGREAQR